MDKKSLKKQREKKSLIDKNLSQMTQQEQDENYFRSISKGGMRKINCTMG